MPVFDLLAFSKALLKYTIIIAMVAYIAGLSFVIGNAIESLWFIVSSSVDAFGSRMSGAGTGGGQAISCAMYMMSALGIDESVGSFVVSAVSLLVLWASIIAHFMIFRITIVFKNLLLEGAK